ncbi:hypothetical protein AK812_SmicGene45684 [Symbiodinium microadriaticum]|uniref:Uncharacterized protein n=1 Tax=Symbiodinium microadriaticum TaxID=2951 RepID=A0A1Q9BVG4_SYMMI|nr:hypothetical protein AK812_SmicGene45684 [Symbiodinium microadriaticum]
MSLCPRFDVAKATATDRPDMEKVALERWRLCFAKAMEEAVATAGPGGSEAVEAYADFNGSHSPIWF